MKGYFMNDVLCYARLKDGNSTQAVRIGKIMEEQLFNKLPQEGTVETREFLPATPLGIVGCSVDSGGSKVVENAEATLPHGQTSSEEEVFTSKEVGGNKSEPPPLVKIQRLGKSDSLPELLLDGEDNKRKRKEDKIEGTLLKTVIEELITGIEDLNKIIRTATNTRRDVVSRASTLDILASKLNNGKLEDMIQSIIEEERKAKAPRMEEWNNFKFTKS